MGERRAKDKGFPGARSPFYSGRVVSRYGCTKGIEPSDERGMVSPPGALKSQVKVPQGAGKRDAAVGWRA